MAQQARILPRGVLQRCWQKSCYLWVRDNELKNEKGEPIEFQRHKFLKDIYDDMTPVQVARKSAQIGYSVMKTLKTMWLAKYRNYNIIYCVDKETELLSKRGWLKYNEIKDGEEILTLKKNGQSSFGKISELFVKEVEMGLISFEGRNFSALTTDNHRWLVKQAKDDKLRFVETKDLVSQAYLIPKWVEEIKDNKEIYSDNLVELLGWIFAEGHYERKDNPNVSRIVISQSHKSNLENVLRIKRIIEMMGIEYKEHPTSNNCLNIYIKGRIPQWIRKEFPDKVLTSDFINNLSTKQKRLLVKTIISGDGWYDKFGSAHFIQKDKRMIDMFMMLSVLAGYTPSLKKQRRDGCYEVTLTQFDYVFCGELKPKQVFYKGIIWCPRTKNGTFYARRNGKCYWTGNTLPTFSDVGQIVPSKVNALIQQNPILGYWTRDKDTTFQKKIGKSFIYYRGTFAKGVAGKEMEAGVGIMLSADLLCMDEADRSSQVVLTQYESRLEASEYKGKWYFSNPTTPGTVTQDVFERSDQKHWFVKCNNGHWQYLDYFENVRDYKFICKKCGIEITDDNRKGGQWVKKYRNRDISGYWVPHLIVPWVSAAQIQTDYETKPREYFYNFVMGLPYIGSEISVNRDIVLKNIDLTGTPNFQEHNVLGVDSGLIKHWVLGNSQGIFRVGSTKEWQDVENLIKTYNVEVAVFDALPDLTEPRRLRDKYSGRIWLNYYKKQVKKADYTKWDYTTHTVYTDRSKAIQQAITDMVDGKVKFQMDKQDLSDYVDHWENMYQKKEKDNLGIERIIWEAGPSKPDHYVHAHVYWHLGMEKAGRSDRGGVVKTVFGRDKPYAGLAPNIAEELRRQAKFDKYK